METIGKVLVIRRVVIGAVDVVIRPQGRGYRAAVDDPGDIPGMIDGFAADEMDVQFGQLAEIQERTCIALADRAAQHQAVIGRVF